MESELPNDKSGAAHVRTGCSGSSFCRLLRRRLATVSPAASPVTVAVVYARLKRARSSGKSSATRWENPSSVDSAKTNNHTRQRGVGTGAHVHRLGGEPDGIDADHWASPRTKRAQPSGSEAGHFTVTDCSPSSSSIITDASAGRLGVPLSGTNAGNAAGG